MLAEFTFFLWNILITYVHSRNHGVVNFNPQIKIGQFSFQIYILNLIYPSQNVAHPMIIGYSR